MGRAFAAFTAAGWGQADPVTTRPGNLTIGVSLGSGYQSYFAGLGAAAQNAEIAAMRAAGITWVRIDVAWTDAVQAGAGASYDWDYPMTTAGPMLAAGMNLVLILLWSPGWARAVGNNPAVPDDPFPTVSPTAYADFCGAAAAHFGPLGASVFELWNEPNLDKGDANSALGLGYLSPVGYAALATAAYREIHDRYVPKPGGSPTPTVLGGVLSGSPRLDWPASLRPGASWPAVTAGATSATVTCPNARADDRYMVATGSAVSVSTSDSTVDGRWPGDTYVSQVTSTGYVLSPPPWLGRFPAVAASGPGTTFGVGHGYPPDVFLTRMYTAAGGAPMFDALSMHPYAYPALSTFRYLDAGSWEMVPALRQIMVANGDGAKSIWFTELGAPTGQNQASWPAAAPTGGQLVMSGAGARAEDVGYLVGAGGLPVGSYVAAVTPGGSWTVLPPTGLTVNESLASGATITTLTVRAAGSVTIAPVDGSTTAPAPTAVSGTVTIPKGATLTVWLGDGNGYYGASVNGFAQPPFTVTTTTGPVTVAPGTSATLDITAVSVPANPGGYRFPPGGLVQCGQTLGQTWAAAVPAATGAVVNLVPPGVAAPWPIPALGQRPSALSTAEQQAMIIAYAYQFVTSTPWPYVGPMFVYCWSDASSHNNAGPYGLTRLDGSRKPAVAALAAIARTGGRVPGLGLPGYT